MGKGKHQGKGQDQKPDAMKSFKDLLRSRGGDTGDDAEEKGGWSLETYHGEELGDSGEKGVDSSRDRITKRPAAFGPMFAVLAIALVALADSDAGGQNPERTIEWRAHGA